MGVLFVRAFGDFSHTRHRGFKLHRLARSERQAARTTDQTLNLRSNLGNRRLHAFQAGFEFAHLAFLQLRRPRQLLMRERATVFEQLVSVFGLLDFLTRLVVGIDTELDFGIGDGL